MLNFVMSQGQWTPRVSLASGSNFFTQYANHKVPPYVWIWITVSVGIVVTITATLVQEGKGDMTWCVIATFCGGGVLLINSLIHFACVNTLMVVKGICIVRGLRYSTMGITMIFLAATTTNDVYSQGDEDTNVNRAFKYAAAGIGIFEIFLGPVINVITLVATQRKI
eukprot:PhF_6_TR38853/c0_g1_i1/m.58101